MVRWQPGVCSVRNAALAAVLVWMAGLAYISFSVYTVQSSSEAHDSGSIVEQYDKAVRLLELMRKQNEELKDLLQKKTVNDEAKASVERKSGPRSSPSTASSTTFAVTKDSTRETTNLFSQQHEVARRALHNSIRELYFYLSNHLAKSEEPFATHAINQMLSLLGQSAAFGGVDKADAWRFSALANISSSMQTYIHQLQNPSDCTAARKLVCNLNKGCGFGCQLHHVTYCFIVAYGTNRTFLLSRDGREWSYSRKGWTAAFLPVSKCSYNQIATDGDHEVAWSSLQSSAAEKVVSLPIVDSLHHRPPFLPLAFPKSIADALLTLHSYPPVFFVSQFMRYLMRPSTEMSERIRESASKVNFDNGPVVGLQIRRTDKVGTEAAFHSLDEYMKWTEIWFQVEEHRTAKSVKRRMYIATDDPSVFAEARQKFSNYEVYGDVSIANTAQLNSRYSDSSLIGVVVDIEMLARCAYLVCTFSSQVCRMGYELMQIRVGDAGDRFHSLDDIYYYGGQQGHEQVAVESYTAEKQDEIDLKVGDVIGIAGNHWNGFSKGTNRRTGANGLYPSYKAREKWIIESFP